MKKQALAAMMMFAATGMGTYPGSVGSKRSVKSTNSVKKPKIIPKGCKEYYFTSTHGDFQHSFTHSYVYYCIASSDKIAVKKFRKWKYSIITT